MASTLYLQLPARAATAVTAAVGTFSTTGADAQWREFLFPYCVASAEKNILQQGKLGLAALSSLAKDFTQVVVLVSASDVTMLKVTVPPMPFAKLKLALPNLLEEQLLADPADLLFIAAPPVDGSCVVAVVSRSWMEQLSRLCESFPVRKISAYSIAPVLPADLPIDLSSNTKDSQSLNANLNTRLNTTKTSVLIESMQDTHEGFDLSVYTQGQQAAGLYLDVSHSASHPEAFNDAIWNALQLFAPQGDLTIYVEPSLTPALQKNTALFQDTTQERTVHFLPIDWKCKLASISSRSLDLFSSLQLEGKKTFDWMRWRWSLILGTCAVLVTVLGLNWEWWTLQRESDLIRASLLSSYKTSFPNETVIRDPLAQMQQKINTAKKLTGQSSNDDFLVLSGLFAQAWEQTLGALPVASVAAMEYRERSLYVTPKNMADVPLDRLRSGLKERSLILDVKEGILKISVDTGVAR